MTLSASESKVRDARRGGGGVACFPFPVETACHHQPSAVAILRATRRRHNVAALMNQINRTCQHFLCVGVERNNYGSIFSAVVLVGR